jgi:orotate phosphoribosyltransferase
MTDISENIANLLLDIKAVTFRFNPPYIYTTGLKSPIYLDNRLVMSYPHVRQQIIDSYVECIKINIGIKNVEWISATATAAIPMGAWIAQALNLPLVYVRSSAKGHGKENQMEGYLEKGKKVLLIEDHISTASSVLTNAEAIKQEGGKIVGCIATSTYETQKAKDNIRTAGIQLWTLTTGKTILEAASKAGMLSKEEKESIQSWFNNPQEWKN